MLVKSLTQLPFASILQTITSSGFNVSTPLDLLHIGLKKGCRRNLRLERLSSSVFRWWVSSENHDFYLNKNDQNQKQISKSPDLENIALKLLFPPFLFVDVSVRKMVERLPRTTKLPRNLKTARVVESLLEPGLGLIVGHLPCQSQSWKSIYGGNS